MQRQFRAHVPLALVVGRARRDSPDAELAAALVDKQDWAVEEAWFRFAPLVLSMAERVLGSRADAEDLTQEVFARVLRRVKTLRERASLRSFIYSIAVRTVRSELRYRRVRAWLTLRRPETLVELGHTTQDVESRDLLRKVHRLLDRLSPRDRLVFILRRVETMTIDEIAVTMDISESTAKRSLTHASKRLLHWIEADPALAQALDSKLGVRSG